MTMWIICKDGFLSVVAHDQDPEVLRVRARRLEHLASAFPDAEIIDFLEEGNGKYDYRWHANIMRTEFEEYLTRTVDEIDYPSHVKESVTGDDQELYKAMMAMWHILHKLQERKPEKLTYDSGLDFDDDEVEEPDASFEPDYTFDEDPPWLPAR